MSTYDTKLFVHDIFCSISYDIEKYACNGFFFPTNYCPTLLAEKII